MSDTMAAATRAATRNGSAPFALVALIALIALGGVGCARQTSGQQPDQQKEQPVSERQALVEDESVLTRLSAAPDETVAYAQTEGAVADIRFGADGAERRPLVIVIHGGFWRPAYDRAHAGPMSDALAKAGWTVATIEYRRVPGKPDVTLQDVRDAVTALPGLATRHNGKAILIGHSAGGHLVLWSAATIDSPAISGVVALAPAADLQLSQKLNLGRGAVLAFLAADATTRPDADPKLLPTPRARIAIVHGALDGTVPPEVSRSYLAAHRGVRFVEVPEAGHMAVIDPLSRAWPAVVAELKRLSE